MGRIPDVIFEDRTKLCSTCQRVLPVSSFAINRRNITGLQGRCRECLSKRDKSKREQRKQQPGYVDGRSLLARKFNADGLKECTVCKQMLPKESYSRHRNTASGYRFACKECEIRARGKEPIKDADGRLIDQRFGARIDISDGFKTCSRCKERKPITEFYAEPHTAHGLRASCKACDSKKSARHVSSTIERFAKAMLSTQRTNVKYATKTRQTKTASNNEMSVELIVSLWQKQEGRCALTGVQMTHIHGDGRVGTNVSIDRIDNAKGYTRDNVRLVCSAINLMRNTLTDDTLVWWAERLVEHSHSVRS